jgi:oligopeptide transport system substrate-binding protein
MRARYLLSPLVIIGSLILSACVSAPNTPTAAPAATPPPNSTPALQASPVPQVVGNFPPRPTATLYQTPVPRPGIFSDADYGVSVQYPSGWDTGPADQPGTLSWFYSPDGQVYAVLFYGPFTPDQTLQQAATQIRDASLTGLNNLTIASDKAIQLADGREAWSSLATASRTDGSQLKVNVTTATFGGRTFTFLIFGSPSAYANNADDITALIDALHLEQAELFGIPRDQSYILWGSESTNPREYDPATTHGSGDKLVYSGLVSFDPQLQLIPELAATWEVTDGITYTFHLRPDARFHNGRPVTAQDVIYSWERAADPKTGSDTVLTYLGDIVGVKAMHDGQADHISGLTAIDDHTLQVVIDAPKPYFLMKLTYPVAFVLDRQNVESGPDWFRSPNGTGPYRLARWDSFKLMLYERNDDYYLQPASIPYVIVQMPASAPIRLYESGDIDISGVSLSDVPRFQDPQEPLHNQLLSGVSLCTGYIYFDVNQPPFDDVKVRQAFTQAFDRQKYIDVVLHGISLPAEGLFPPGLPGYNPNLKGLPYDPAQARQLLAQSKYGGADQLPPIVFTEGGTGSDIGPSTSALAQMWQQNLGVTITVENLDPNKAQDELHAGHHGQIFSGGWCADYPDPENFADVLFHTGAEQNLGHYSNPQVDQLLEQARVEQDVNQRMQLYQQAEQLIVDDAAVLFTTHSLSFVLVKPYIKGYVLTPIDVPLERYLSIDPSKLGQ